MKAVVFKGVGCIALEEVPDPQIQYQTDAIVKITMSALCGTDLHLVRGSIADVKKGTILGHEGVGIVEQIGSEVKNVKVGDRVIISATAGCGHCFYCHDDKYSQCDTINPNGPEAGTVFFGGPIPNGSLDGMQAEKVRVPHADVNLIKIPAALTDEQVILLTDILPTAYMAVDVAEITKEDSVAVFGCGPVGQLVIACLKHVGVKEIFAVDNEPSRLERAHQQGAHVIDFNKLDPVQELKRLTNNRGPSRVIDAVGIDAEQPECCGVEYFKGLWQKAQFKDEVAAVAPKTKPDGENWHPGNAPSQVLQWAVQSVAKHGLVSIVGVYPSSMVFFPIGVCMSKNLTIKIVNCNHRTYIPTLLNLVQDGAFDLKSFITQVIDFDQVIDAYKHFDTKDNGWIKVVMKMKR